MERFARSRSAVADFVHDESRSALVLLAAAITALVWANSPLSGAYESLFRDTALAHAIGEGLMAVFFLVVGVEVTREIREGELQGGALVPILAAIGGMAVPVLCFLALAPGEALRGWAIPTATDVAFALGVLTALGSRVPPALRAFLLALAVADDIGAVVVIATVYAHGGEPAFLLAAVALLALFAFVARRGPWPLLVPLGLAVWAAVRLSGVHATIAGVALGVVLPAARARQAEDVLHPWSAFLVLPVFALANAGVRLAGAAPGRLALAVLVGLVVGKPIGILAGAWLATRRRPMPAGVTWRHLTGVGLLGGIGFTVSLFVAGLAYDDAAAVSQAKMGILGGSVLAAAAGAAVLRRAKAA